MLALATTETLATVVPPVMPVPDIVWPAPIKVFAPLMREMNAAQTQGPQLYMAPVGAK